jgi:hypothetical protein
MTTTNHQGRDPKQYGNQEKSASFAIMVLAIATLIALAVNKCQAQPAYLIVTQQTGEKVQTHKVTTAAAADSIVNVIYPGFNTAAAMQQTVYYEQKTQNNYVYIERKQYVKIRRNGTVKLRRVK